MIINNKKVLQSYMNKKIAFIIFSFLILICLGYSFGKDSAERERRNKDKIIREKRTNKSQSVVLMYWKF